MLRRDKENRELRKRNHEKFYETRERMLHVKKTTDPKFSLETLARVRKETEEKAIEDRKVYYRFFVKFLLICIALVIIIVFSFFYF